MCKENKNNDLIQQFLLFRVSLRPHVQESTATHACSAADAGTAFWRRTWMRCTLFTSKTMHAVHKSVFVNMSEDFNRGWLAIFLPSLTYSNQNIQAMITEEKKLSNKVVIFVLFAHKKYSRSFIKLRLNPWCHMDYFNDVFTTFLGLEGSESSQISSKIS